jgi:hypothetical protein
VSLFPFGCVSRSFGGEKEAARKAATSPPDVAADELTSTAKRGRSQDLAAWTKLFWTGTASTARASGYFGGKEAQHTGKLLRLVHAKAAAKG